MLDERFLCVDFAGAQVMITYAMYLLFVANVFNTFRKHREILAFINIVKLHLSTHLPEEADLALTMLLFLL